MLELLKSTREAYIANTTHGNTNRGGGNRNTTRRNRKTPDNTSFQRLATNRYCWTHGACNHASGSCNRKEPGYQDVATTANRMDGSNTLCVVYNVVPQSHLN